VQAFPQKASPTLVQNLVQVFSQKANLRLVQNIAQAFSQKASPILNLVHFLPKASPTQVLEPSASIFLIRLKAKIRMFNMSQYGSEPNSYPSNSPSLVENKIQVFFKR